MKIVFLLIGILGGVLGGLGMGGGTILIPLLSFTSLSQHTAQAINLVSFIPMAIVSLVIHAKNGLVEKKGIFAIIVPAVAFAILGSIFASVIKGKILKKCFGGFLVILSVFSLLSSQSKQGVKSLKKSKKNQKKFFKKF